jgi:glutaredoxin
MLCNLPLRSRLGLAALVLGFGAALQAIGGWSQARLGAQAAAAARPGDIQMLASANCTYCVEARAWFDRNHVPFTECTIEHDAACAQAYGALMAPGTPVLLVRGQRLLGFNAQAVADALAVRSQ